MKTSPIERFILQCFTYEQPNYPQAVLATPQLVEGQASLLGALAAADRPPTPPELRVPDWGSSIAKSLGNTANMIASIPERSLAYQKAQAELPAQKEAARTDYIKQIAVNQQYLKYAQEHPEIIPAIINSKETGIGPIPMTPGSTLSGQNPAIGGGTGTPAPTTPAVPTTTPAPTAPTVTVPTGTPVRQAQPAGQASTVPTHDPRLTSAMIAANGTPLTASTGDEGAISTDTGASPAAAELKQSTEIPVPEPVNGDEVAKAYSKQIAPTSGWHREVNQDGSLGRFVMEHKDKDIPDQPLHDDWLQKLGVTTPQANPQLAGQVAPAAPPPVNATQGPEGLVVQPAAIPAIPGTIPPPSSPSGDEGLIQVSNNGVRPPRALPANGWTPPRHPTSSANPTPAQAPPVVGPTPLPASPTGPNNGDNIWQQNYGGMSREEVGRLSNDPKKVTYTGNYTTTVGGQSDPEITIPGQGVNKDKQFPVYVDSHTGERYTKVGDTGYDHWRYSLTPGIEPVHVQDEIGKDAMLKMQAKVIEMGQGDANFQHYPREQQIAEYRAAVALDNARKDRNPEYDAKVDASEKVVDAATDLQQELDKLKTDDDPSGVLHRNALHQFANNIMRHIGTSLPGGVSDAIKQWTSNLPGGAIDPMHQTLNNLNQSYETLKTASRLEHNHNKGESGTIPKPEGDASSLGYLTDSNFDEELSKYSTVSKNDLNALLDHGIANSYNIPQRALQKGNAILSPTSIGNDSQNPYKLTDPDNAKNKSIFDKIPDGAWMINSDGVRMRKGMLKTKIIPGHV